MGTTAVSRSASKTERGWTAVSVVTGWTRSRWTEMMSRTSRWMSGRDQSLMKSEVRMGLTVCGGRKCVLIFCVCIF